MEFYAVMRFKLTPGRLQTAAVHLGREWLRYAQSCGGKPEPKHVTVSWAGLEGEMDLVPYGWVEPQRGKVEGTGKDSGASGPAAGGVAPVVDSVPDGPRVGGAEAPPKSDGVRGKDPHVHPSQSGEVRAASGKGRPKAVS